MLHDDGAGAFVESCDERGQFWSLEEGKGWFRTQGKFVSDIKVDDLGVYASNTDSRLYCLEPQTGRIKWQYYGSAPLKTAPVVTATMVYQFVPGQGVVGIDKMQGEFNRKPRWIIKNAVQALSEDAENVYLRRRDNRLMAVNLHAPIQFTLELLPTLCSREEAHIVNVASICGLVSIPTTDPSGPTWSRS